MPIDIARYQPVVHGLMRIVFGFLYWSHGAQKLLGCSADLDRKAARPILARDSVRPA